MTNSGQNFHKGFLILFFTGVAFLVAVSASHSQEKQAQWVQGPTVADLGNNIAEIKVPENYIFANGDDTRKIMEGMGNPPTQLEVGLIAPAKETEGNWFVVFEYEAVGYIADDDKDELDADKILTSLKQGNESGNAWRKENGFQPIYLNGWHKVPEYDAATHNLVWATLIGGNEQQSDTVNYNIRLLGRGGYMSVTLVADSSIVPKISPELENLINGFEFKKGLRYAEFVKGDKMAAYGLTALIAGGAGAAAVKYGLFAYLAKYWKIAIAGIIAFFAGIRNKFMSLFSRKQD